MSFAENLIRGLQAGQQHRQQKQAEIERAEDRKLQKVLLQHQLRTMGIQEKLEKRQAQLAAHGQRDGQPESSFPISEAGFAPTPNAAPAMFDGMPLPGQSFGLEAKREIAPSILSAVEEYGIPETRLLPQTAEQKMAAEAARTRAAELNKGRVMRPGDKFNIGTETIAENPRPVDSPTLGSFEHYMGASPEERAQIEAARKGYQQADDRPRISINTPEPVVMVQTVDDQGNPVTRVLPRSEATGQTFRSQPTAGQQDARAELESGIELITDIREQFKPEYVGPVQGRLNAAKLKTPGVRVDPAMAQFFGANAALKNEIIRLITGAAVSKQEGERIMQEIPDIPDKPEVFEAKLLQTERNRMRLLNAARQRAGLPAASQPTGRGNPAGPGAPALGTRRTVNGQAYEWDGRGWKPAGDGE